MIAEFETEAEASDFMAFLNENNNQGHQQVIYRWGGGNNVEYSYYNVIHDDLRESVRTYLEMNNKENK